MTEKRKKILIVDDTEINRILLAGILADEYDIEEASDGEEAIELLKDAKHAAQFSLILLDVVMPKKDGFDVLAEMHKLKLIELIPVVMISAEVSPTYIDHAYELGATDYINRPFVDAVVLRRVRNTIMLFAKQKYMEDLVTEQIMEKERTSSQMVEILSNIVEFRNGESGLHVLHIRVITNLLLQCLRRREPELELTSAQIALIANASAMHDIGKISIDEKILNKPGRLTNEEYEIMKTHTVIGAKMLMNTPQHANSELLRMAHDICRWHHERYDGRGYPDGLKGEEIPLAAQVVSIADVYDALISPRAYKPALHHEEAVQMIVNGECGMFSPRILECFLEIADRVDQELDIHSPRSVSNMEIKRVASELMNHSELRITSRTVTLLEQERIKYDFYASMTKEILFEYDRGTGILEFSEWGAKYLNLPTLIQEPLKDKRLAHWSASTADMQRRLGETTPDQPVASASYSLNVAGGARWFKVVARTIWDSEDQPTYAKVVGKLMDIHEEQLKLNEFKKLASRDSLTGLYNHKTIREMIVATLKRGEGRQFLVLLIDLDFFKNANDHFGHHFGDEVLKYVATCILNGIRKEDLAARIGGDEFLVFMEYKGDAEKLVDRVFGSASKEYNGFPISLSMGASLYPEDAEDYETLVLRADLALYAAKAAGKGKYLFYNRSMVDFPAERTPIDIGPTLADGRN